MADKTAKHETAGRRPRAAHRTAPGTLVDANGQEYVTG